MPKTNYIVVVDYEDGQKLSNCFLLGWNDKYDWYDTDTCGDKIMTSTGEIEENEFGIIEVSNHVGVYCGETEHFCRCCSDGGNIDGYDCTVCRLEKDNYDWNLIPV